MRTVPSQPPPNDVEHKDRPARYRRHRGCPGRSSIWLTLLVVFQLTSLRCSGAPAWSAVGDTVFTHVIQSADMPKVLMPQVIIQDREGFLWMGGQSGLVRWDGYRFKGVPLAKDGDGAIPSEWVRTIHLDADGRPWMGTMGGGLMRLDPASGQWSRPDLGKSGLDVRGISDDGMHGLWVATGSGLFRVDAAGKVVRRLRRDADLPDRLPSDAVKAVLLDDTGALWVGTNAGLGRIATIGGRLQPVPLPTPMGEPPKVSQLMEDGFGRVWVGTVEQGAYVVAKNGANARAIAETVHGGSGADQVRAIAEVADGRIWLGTMRGIVEVDGQELAARRIVADPLKPHGLDSNSIYALGKDRSGIVWVSTDQGVSKFHTPRGITTFFGTPSRPGLRDGNLSAVLAFPDGRIWAGSRFTGLDVRALRADTTPSGNAVEGNVLCMAAGADRVFLGTDNGLYVTDPLGRSVAKVAFAGRPPSEGIQALWASGDTLWIGGIEDGLWQVLMPRAGPWKVVRHETAGSLTGNHVWALQPMRGGVLAVATSGGISLVDDSSPAIERIVPKRDRPDGLPSSLAQSLAVDHLGRLWVGTVDAGIGVMTGRDAGGHAEFRRVSVGEGLPDGDIDRMLVDQMGRVWASTDAGLAVIDPNSFAVQAITRADGLPITAYWNGSGEVGPDGDLLFGGTTGLTRVAPVEVAPWTYQGELAVTEVQLGDRTLPGTGLGSEPLKVPADADSIAVEFADLDFSSPETNKYEYMLLGYDRKWMTTDARRRLAAYTNLPPGSYELQLRATNHIGAWTMRKSAVRITVQPTWYQTMWFRAAEALGTLLVIAAVVQLRTHLLRRKQRELESVVAERTSALSDSRKQLEQFAYFDTLTGLPNRRAFQQELDGLIARSTGGAMGGFMLVLVDLDGFKRVNDTMGHDAGDGVLVTAAHRLREAVREGDFVARLGGDEFAIILHSPISQDGLDALCERLVVGMAEPITLHDRSASIGASAGAARHPGDGTSSALLLKHADIALYAAKDGGRGTWRAYESLQKTDASVTAI